MSNEIETEGAQRLERPRVEALDRILGEPLKVLDDGFVRVVDYMGDDSSIVQAARVSYGKGTKKVQEDRGLIRYLRDVRNQAARARPDGLLAAVDPAPLGLDQRVLHALFDRHRCGASHRGGSMAAAIDG